MRPGRGVPISPRKVPGVCGKGSHVSPSVDRMIRGGGYDPVFARYGPFLSKRTDVPTPATYNASVPSGSRNTVMPRNAISRAVNLVGVPAAFQRTGMSSGDLNTRCQVPPTGE